MTKQVQTRVLAYTMAKEITDEELKTISGAAVSGSVHPTLHPSCSGWPSQMDISVDSDIRF